MPTTQHETIQADIARRRVNRFVTLTVGDRMYAGQPTEFYDLGKRLFWAVPVMIASSNNRKRVGQILVDAETGELQIANNTVEELATKALDLP